MIRKEYKNIARDNLNLRIQLDKATKPPVHTNALAGSVFAAFQVAYGAMNDYTANENKE